MHRRDIVVITLFTAFSVWLYAGFMFPGSYMLSYGSVPRTILWFIRILFPFLFIGLIVLYRALRLHRVRPGELTLLVIFAAIGLFVCYGIADSVYQGWFDSHRREYHPFLQLMPPHNVRLDASHHGPQIFCLGGSTTELPDRVGRDWPSRVEAILHERYGWKDVEVINLGREWYTSLHTLINYETNLRKYRPAAILIMQSVNDLLQNADFSYLSHGPFREDYGHFYGPVSRIVDRRSLWHYLRDVFNGLWYSVPRKSITVDFFPGLSAYQRNIRTIAELAKHDGTTVILMTEPCLAKSEMSDDERSAVGMIRVEAINDTLVWSTQTLVNGMEQYNDAMHTIAVGDSLPFIELDRQVPKSLLYFRDEVHYTDTTFSIIAPFIARRLYEISSSRGIVR